MLRNRRWVRRAVAATAGVAFVAALTPAMSAVAQEVGLPMPGVDYELKLSSSDVRLSVQERQCSASLVGSVEAEAKVKLPESGGNVISMDFDDMELRGSSSSCQGKSTVEGLGTIRIKQDDTTITPENVLTMTSVVPPTFKQTVFMDFTMTIENPPSWLQQRSAQQAQPLTLVSKKPGELIGELTTIPPQGAVFKLQNPIELVLPGQDETIATLNKLPLKVQAL